MKFYLIRHGQTTGDIEDRIGGSYDDHLTEEGRQQLQTTADKLAKEKIDIIFSSSLIRAQESGEIIKEILQCPIQVEPDLRERHYGVITGLTKTEAKQKYPEAIQRHTDLSYTHPEGESYPDFYKRVITCFKNIVSYGYESVGIIGHGGSLKCILKFLEEPLPNKIDDGGIIPLNYHLKKSDNGVIELVKINDPLYL